MHKYIVLINQSIYIYYYYKQLRFRDLAKDLLTFNVSASIPSMNPATGDIGGQGSSSTLEMFNSMVLTFLALMVLFCMFIWFSKGAGSLVQTRTENANNREVQIVPRPRVSSEAMINALEVVTFRGRDIEDPDCAYDDEVWNDNACIYMLIPF